jgi:hypothetical protein
VIRLLLFLLLAGGLSGYAVWVYARAELPVRGRWGLASLRATALVILLALLFDAHLPWGPPASAGARWVLLDASLSMSAAGGVPWDSARSLAEGLGEEGWTVVPFGRGVLDSLPPGIPQAVGSEVGPALSRAREAGAREVVVLSDLRFEDPVAAQAALSDAFSVVRFENVAPGARNVGLGRFVVEDQPTPRNPVRAELELFGEGMGDSVIVEFREEGRLVLAQTIGLPSPGLRSSVTVELPPVQGEGRLRYSAAAVTGGDDLASDDEVVGYMSAGRGEGGLVLVSLRPDWEPRALLSVLTDVTGLSATGYLRVGTNRFALMGRAAERSSPTDSSRVSLAASEAAMVVIHGLDGDLGPLARSLVRSSSRLLVWPTNAAGSAAVGVRTAPPQGGEWYASSAIPASPVAADLARLPVQGLPPLANVLLPVDGESVVGPLQVQLGGTGPSTPGLVLRAAEGRRTAVILASGFWRWAARGGTGLETYRRLWSGVAGWLLAADADLAASRPRPEKWVFGRDETVTWRVPGQVGDSMVVAISSDGELVTELALPAGTGVPTGPLPPGSYTYRFGDPGDPLLEGRFDVAARTDELAIAPARMDGLNDPGEGSGGGEPESGRPLRTASWPYLLALGLLCVEWIGRRRAGLR